MKILLLQKQTLKQFYRYFATFASLLLFLFLLFYVGVSNPINHLGSTLDIPFLLLLAGYVVSIPLVLFSYLYHRTNVHYVASIPMTRMEIFISQYSLGLVFGLTMILSYTSLTTLMMGSQNLWLSQVTHLLVLFFYYYNLCVLCYWICGNKLFYTIMVLFLTFGPLVFYFVSQWFLIATVNGYVSANLSYNTLDFLFPLFGIIRGLNLGILYNYTMFYLVVSIVLLILSLVASRYRRNEIYYQSITFTILSYFIRFFIALISASTILTLLQSSSWQVQRQINYLVYLVVCMLVVYMVEMIFTKNAKVFYSLKYGVLLSVFIFVFFKGAAAYAERYVPTNVSRVIVSAECDAQTLITWESNNEEFIEDVQEMHQDLRLIGPYKYQDEDWVSINIKYLTGFGNYSERGYAIDVDTFMEMIEPYFAHEEFSLSLFGSEYQLLALLDKKETLVITDNEKVYHLESEEQRYLLKNYLEDEIEKAQQNPKAYLVKKLAQEPPFYAVSLSLSKDNTLEHQMNLYSELVSHALSKTFQN